MIAPSGIGQAKTPNPARPTSMDAGTKPRSVVTEVTVAKGTAGFLASHRGNGDQHLPGLLGSTWGNPKLYPVPLSGSRAARRWTDVVTN